MACATDGTVEKSNGGRRAPGTPPAAEDRQSAVGSETSTNLPPASLKWNRADTGADHRSLCLRSRAKLGTSTVTVAS